MKKTLIFITLVAAFVLSACASQQKSPTAPASAPILITDALGREVALPSAPQRIVITGKALFMITDAAYLFPEAPQRIIALGNAGQGTSNFIAQIDPDYADKAILAGDAGAEQIAALQPDLVILKSFLAKKVGQPIEELGIPVIYVDFETPEQYTRDLTILGQVFQNPARAAEIAAYFQDSAAAVQEALRGVDEKPRVLMLYHTTQGGTTAFNVPPADWMQTRLVEMAGGVPVWADSHLSSGWTEVSLEQIAAWDPEYIFIIDYWHNPAEVVAQLRDDPNWAALRAVQAGRLDAFPGDLYSWDQPDPRWALGLGWLAARLHPDQFPDYDVTAQARDFYSRLYGLDEAFFNAHILPVLPAE